MKLVKRCSLCGGKLDQNKRCVECGLDNTKNDDMYKGMMNKNNCDDESLTHVHNESAVDKKQYKTQSYSKEQSESVWKTVNTPKKSSKNIRNQNKKKGGKIVAIISLIVVLLPSIFQIFDTAVGTDSYPEEVWYDNDFYLDPGLYTVGVHIPAGTYVVEDFMSDYGTIEVLMLDDLSEYDYYTWYDLEDGDTFEISLYEGQLLDISAGMSVTFSTNDDVEFSYDMTENPLTESYVVSGSAVAGQDFPAGVYDIYYTPDSDEDYCEVYYRIMDTENQEVIFEDSQYLEGYRGSTFYYNVMFTEGSQIGVTNFQEITLMPSEWIDSRLLSDYEDGETLITEGENL